MKYILLKRRNFSEYVDRETNDLTLSDLTHFLSEIDFDDMDKYIAWAKDKKQNSYGTNTTYIDKYVDEVCITMDADGSEFRMPLQAFIKLLEQWKECVSKNSELIIVIQEDNKFNCKPFDEDKPFPGGKRLILTELQRQPDGDYWRTKYNKQLESLTYLLLSQKVAVILKWLSSETKKYQADVFYLDKENDQIALEAKWSKTAKNPIIELSRENFIDILNQWDKLVAEKKDFITIEKKNDRIVIQGR